MPRIRRLRGLMVIALLLLIATLAPAAPALAGGAKEKQFECRGDNRHRKFEALLTVDDDGTRDFEVAGRFDNRKNRTVAVAANGVTLGRDKRVPKGEFELKRENTSAAVARGSRITVTQGGTGRSISCTLARA